MQELSLKLFIAFAFLLCISCKSMLTLGSSPKLKWSSISMSSAGQYLAATTAFYPYPGQLYTSSDFGQTWNYKYNISLNFIVSNSSGQLIAGTSVTSVYISTDYGTTYTFVDLDTNQGVQYLAVNAQGNYIYAFDYAGSFFRSNDSGASFTNITALWAGTGSLYDLQTNNEGNFLILSTNNKGIYRSFDYGDTWTLNTNGTSNFDSMSLDATGQYIFATTSEGKTYRSTNYGLNFTYTPTGNSQASGTYTASSQDGIMIYLAGQTSLWVSYSAGKNFSEVPITVTSGQSIAGIACDYEGTLVSVAISGGSIAVTSEAPPTSMPSSQPTSVPSCMNGNGQNDDHGGCSTCAPGTYLTALGGVCEICPVGYYTADYGETECSKCEYPTKSVFDESDACDGFSLDANITTTLIVMGVLAVIVLLCILTSINKVVVMANLVLPILDLFSDIAYLMTNDFYSPILFALGVLCVIFPVPGFFYIVYKQQAVMPQLTWRLNRIWWLSEDQITCYRIICQFVTIVGYPVMILCNILFLFFWIFVGIFLHLTKTLAVGNVWNMWFSLWTGTDQHNTDVDVDTEALNGSLQHQFYFETLPQVLLQLVNNILLKDFTPLAIFSLVQSLVMALNGIWRFIYYSYIVKNPVPLKDIPIDKSIRFRIKSFGIDVVLFDGRLQPSSKSDKAGLRESLIDEDKKVNVFSNISDNSVSNSSDPNDRSVKRENEGTDVVTSTSVI